MKAIKRISSGFFAVVLALLMCIQPVFAASEYTYKLPAAYSTYYASDVQNEALAKIRTHLVNREAVFTVNIPSEFASQFFDGQSVDINSRDEVLDRVFEYTGNPKEGGYLFLSTGHLEVTDITPCAGFSRVEFIAAYYSQGDEEAAVDSRVSEILNRLNVWNSTDYEKVSAVHDYIAENVTYDYNHLGNDEYYRQFTAYAALVDGTAVCQGYAALFSRLLNELGVENCAISSKSLNHTWNIVKLDGKFYNVDVTWDSDSNTDKYFLKGSRDFTGHTNSDDQFSVESFKNTHILSEYKYGSAAADGILAVLGYVNDYTIKTADGRSISTQPSDGRGKVYIWGSSDCPFTPILIETLKGQSFSGIDIYVCLTDVDSAADIPAEFARPACVTYCIKTAAEDWSAAGMDLYNAMYDMYMESGIADMWVNSPTTFMVNAKGQIVYAAAGCIDNLPQEIESYLGSSAPDTGDYHDHEGDHSWKLVTVIDEPSAEKTGKASYICETCGKIKEEQLPRADGTVRGRCGDNIDWIFYSETGTLVINGTGEMYPNYTNPNGIGWASNYAYAKPASSNADEYIIVSDVKKVTISEGITAIAGCDFSNFSNMESIVIPKTVKSIGEDGYPAFSGCNSLKCIYYTGTKSQWNNIDIIDYSGDLDNVLLCPGLSSLKLNVMLKKTLSQKDLQTADMSFGINASCSGASFKYESLSKRCISVTDTGIVTVKKGTPKGTYKVRVTASSPDLDSISKTVKIVVK